jgi:biopolymer transport protein TolR
MRHPALASHRLQVSSKINVTPLVDVCLVLLIVFMVVTPMLHGSGEVALPATPRPSSLPESQNQLTITMPLGRGGVRVGPRWIALKDLAPALEQARREDPDRKVVIMADGRLEYRAVLTVMRQLSEAGFRRAGLAARRQAGGGGAEPAPGRPRDHG